MEETCRQNLLYFFADFAGNSTNKDTAKRDQADDSNAGYQFGKAFETLKSRVDALYKTDNASKWSLSLGSITVVVISSVTELQAVVGCFRHTTVQHGDRLA